jgi:hypothetical protein
MYILLIWTIVAANGAGNSYDWRYLGTFHGTGNIYATGLEECRAAARQLNLSPQKYACVVSK